jgi:hypothetical protein
MTRRLLLTRLALLGALTLLAIPAAAKTVSTKGFQSKVKVGGADLVLNGVGMREATMFKVDVYRGGLYLKSKSSDAKAILAKDEPWMIEMKFVRDVEKDKLTEAWTDGFKTNGKGKGQTGLKTLNGYMSDIGEGDTMTFAYDPAKGTAVKVKGKTMGTIAGKDFAWALLAVWLGDKSPNKGLKDGMLGQ